MFLLLVSFTFIFLSFFCMSFFSRCLFVFSSTSLNRARSSTAQYFAFLTFSVNLMFSMILFPMLGIFFCYPLLSLCYMRVLVLNSFCICVFFVLCSYPVSPYYIPIYTIYRYPGSFISLLFLVISYVYMEC